MSYDRRTLASDSPAFTLRCVHMHSRYARFA